MQLLPFRHLLIYAIVVLLLNASPLVAVEIIAHRGASHDAPENTLAAFKLGWEQRADADELDIHLTKDGQIVVIHDADTKRTTGVSKAVSQSTLEECAGSMRGAGKARSGRERNSRR